MKKFTKNSKHMCLYSERIIYLIKNEQYLKLSFEDDIEHIELDYILTNNIYIVCSSKILLGNLKRNKLNISQTHKIEKIEKLNFIKFLYLKNNHSLVLIINNILYLMNDIHELKSFNFENCIVESYITSDKSIGESVVMCDDSFNFFVFDWRRFQIKSKFTLFENQTKQNKIFNFNFFPTSEGFVFFWFRKNHLESVLIKSIENLKNIKFNKGNNNYLNSLNLNESSIKLVKRKFSFYSKDVSLLMFLSCQKLCMIINWNKKKRFNYCEIETGNEILDVNFSILKVKFYFF